jgi:hypothetical protein
MKITDRIKEEVGLHKLLMTMSSAVSISLAGWLCDNFYGFSIKFLLACFGTVFFLALTFFFLARINNKIKELDK